MLRVRNLRAGYGSLEVVRSVSLHVADGEIVTVIGANGAGKSSLLRTVVGLLPAWAGHIDHDGVDITASATWRRTMQGVVLVPEGRQIFADMSVLDNLIVGGYRNPARVADAEKVMDRFPRLRERARQAAGTLSGGEQQMLAIGRALVGRPKLLLLDEPSMGLAPLIVQEVFQVIQELRDAGVTVFLVEQNAVMALSVADRAYVLEMGEIIMEGDARQLLQNPDVKRAYLGKGYKEVWE